MKIYDCSEGNKIIGSWVNIICYYPCPYLNFPSLRSIPTPRLPCNPLPRPIFDTLILGWVYLFFIRGIFDSAHLYRLNWNTICHGHWGIFNVDYDAIAEYI